MSHRPFTIMVSLTEGRTVDNVRNELEEKGVKITETSSVYKKNVCYCIECDPTIIPSLDGIGKVAPLFYGRLCNSD